MPLRMQVKWLKAHPINNPRSVLINYIYHAVSSPKGRLLPVAQMAAKSVVHRREPTGAALIHQISNNVLPERCFQQAHVPTPPQLRHNINLVHIPTLQIPLLDKTHRCPTILIPWTLTDIAPVLLVKHIEVRPVRASIRIRSDRQSGSSKRAANHGAVDAVGTAIDDCAPGANTGGARC